MILVRQGSPFDIDPLFLQSVPIKRRDRLPNARGVYFVMSPTREVLYIGKSNSLLRRWIDHHRIIEFEEKATRIAYKLLPENVNLERVEYALIQFYKPLMNSQPNYERLFLCLEKQDIERLKMLSKFYHIGRTELSLKLLRMGIAQVMNGDEFLELENKSKKTID